MKNIDDAPATKDNKMQAANSLSYFGGKGSDGTFQTIINQIPKHDLFIETHAGLARITEHLDNINGITILNDISSHTCKMLEAKFKERIIPSSLLFDLISPECIKEKFVACHGKVIIENMDAIDLLEKYKPLLEVMKTVIFSDPPYPLDSRKSNRERYEFEMTDSQHYELIHYLKKVSCFIIICTYPNMIYETEFSSWRNIHYYSNTRKGMALEYLFLNFDTPWYLQTIKFYGKDFRERERYKKIKKNLESKLKSIPKPILNHILYEFS